MGNTLDTKTLLDAIPIISNDTFNSPTKEGLRNSKEISEAPSAAVFFKENGTSSELAMSLETLSKAPNNPRVNTVDEPAYPDEGTTKIIFGASGCTRMFNWT